MGTESSENGLKMYRKTLIDLPSAIGGIFRPVFGRRHPEGLLETDAEIFRAGETRHERNLGYCARRLAQKLARPLQTDVCHELMD